MTQESIVLSTTPPFPGADAVAAINKANQAIATDFAGAIDPAALAGSYMTWNDTGTGRRRMRNAANTAWIDIGGLTDLTPTETLVGSPKVATQAQTDAGVDDATIVTPKKLRWGVSMSLGPNGYLVLPSWLGGVIFQWGSATGTGSNAIFPIAFASLWIVQGVCTSGTGPTSSQVYGMEAVNVSNTSFSPYTYAMNTSSAAPATPATKGMAWFAIGK